MGQTEESNTPLKNANISDSMEEQSWVDKVARFAERIVPDALTTSILLMVFLALLAISIGESFSQVANAYYEGLWQLLGFTMQMTLILAFSMVIAASSTFKKLILTISYIPKTTNHVIIVMTILTALLAYLNWGLALALGPMICVHFAKEAERKNISLDYPWFLAVGASAASVWQFGLSATAPLMMTSSQNFLVDEVSTMSLSTTIFAPASIIMVIGHLVLTIITACIFMPKMSRPISNFTESNKLADLAITPPEPIEFNRNITFAQKMEHSSLVIIPLCFALVVWIYQHFIVKGNELDINTVNTILLLVGFLMHGSVSRYTDAFQNVIRSAWPIILFYHLYAGVAGLIQFTSLGNWMAGIIDPFTNSYTFPFFTVLISSIVASFIPSSGGQWVIQGFVISKIAKSAGVTFQRGLLALSVGDHMGNLVAPFWTVVAAGIARVDFRKVYGYQLIFAVIWFILGIFVFTFLPC
ncbi:TIGR00366 family protein [Thermodesulfobacteriota bacterium]